MLIKIILLFTDFPTTARHLRCEYCAALFRPDNHKVMLKPMLKANKKVLQLLCKNANGGKLTSCQRAMLEHYRKSHNVIVGFVYKICVFKTQSILYCVTVT